MAAKKNNKIATARKQFVQQRVQATGKTGKEARQQFRQRFDKLSQTKEGRIRIAEVTQVKGIRKELAKNTRKTTTTKTGTTSTTKTGTTTNKTGTTGTTKTGTTGITKPTGRITDSVDRIGYRSPTGLGKNQRRVVITPQELAQVQRELYPTPTTPPKTVPRSGAAGQYDVVLPPGKKDRGKGLDSWKRFLGL